MLVQGLDAQKKVVWTYRTKKYRAAQLTPTKGILRGNKVYVLEGTKIIVLRKKDGKKFGPFQESVQQAILSDLIKITTYS